MEPVLDIFVAGSGVVNALSDRAPAEIKSNVFQPGAVDSFTSYAGTMHRGILILLMRQ